MDNNPIALNDVLGLSTRGDGGTWGSCPTFGGSNEASSSDNIGGSIASGIMNDALLNDHNAFTLYNTSNIVGQIGHQVNPSNFKASLSNLHSNLQINANLDILYLGSKSVVKIHQKAHENSLNRKERKHSKDDSNKLLWLNEGTVIADEFQDSQDSYRHANQTVEEVKDFADKFVRKQFMEAKRLIKEGKRKEAYIEFSIGLHTLQDATSISNNGFQPWSNDDPLLSKAVHVTNELIYPGKESNLQKITNKYLDWFENDSRPLPSGNLFDNIKADWK